MHSKNGRKLKLLCRKEIYMEPELNGQSENNGKWPNDSAVAVDVVQKLQCE